MHRVPTIPTSNKMTTTTNDEEAAAVVVNSDVIEGGKPAPPSDTAAAAAADNKSNGGDVEEGIVGEQINNTNDDVAAVSTNTNNNDNNESTMPSGSILADLNKSEPQTESYSKQSLDIAFTGDEDDIPPPPPPPLPPGGIQELNNVNGPSGPGAHITSSTEGTNGTAEAMKEASAKKRKKIIIIVLIMLVICGLAIGLGLGFGLDQSNSSDDGSKNAADNSSYAADNSNIDSENVDDDVDSYVEEEVWEGVSTTAATTIAVAPDGDENEENAIVVTTTAVPEIAEPEIYDAIIVGAGWAGLKAMQTLLDANIQPSNLLVLESSNYIGGRSYTKNSADGSHNNPNLIENSDNVPYELGAEWLYNTGNNMVTSLINDGFLPEAVVSGNSNTMRPMDGTYFLQTQSTDDDDEPFIRTKVIDNVDQWLDTMWTGNNAFLQYRENRLDDDLDGATYEEAIDAYIDRWGWTDDESLQFFNLLEDSTEIESAGDSSQLSVQEMEFWPASGNDDQIDTYYMGMPGGGFGNVAAKYAESFRERIKLNSKVNEINSMSLDTDNEDGDYTVVTYVDKDGSNQSVKAKTVLVTVSLGVLKEGTINFVPSLPETKQTSIDNMGFGLMNKCILSWNDEADMVWPEDELWFLLVTPKDETSGQWTRFYNPTKLKGGKPTLVAWIAGAEAWDAETQTNDEIVTAVMNNLRAMFPTISMPDLATITRWGQNEHQHGAHTFPVAGRDIADDAASLKETFGNIWFAGEATGNGWGTTVGAWNTGMEAGEAMARRLKES